MNQCANCEVTLDLPVNFCPNCGQNSRKGRLKVSNIVHEFSHAMFHTDKSIFSLVWHLVHKPGTVAREYVLGKRKKYFNPFNFLVLAVAFSIFFISLSHIQIFGQEAKNPIEIFMSRHFNLIIFLTVPLLALGTWLFFRRQGFNYAECAVLAAYSAGERTLFHVALVVPIQMCFPGSFTAIITSYMIVYASYYGFACMQFTLKYTGRTFIKGILCIVFLQFSIFIMVSIAYTVYYFFLYHGKPLSG